MTLYEWAEYIRKWREEKGFTTPSTIEGTDAEYMLGKLMLVVSEVGEAAEAVRHHDLDNFKEEIADTFIRLLDICGTMQIDPEIIIATKMRFNEKRPHKHGKKTDL